MSYVPAYMGNVAKVLLTNDQLQSVQKVIENGEMPVKQGFSGLWDINVTVRAEDRIERLASRNHPV